VKKVNLKAPKFSRSDSDIDSGDRYRFRLLTKGNREVIFFIN